jgi:hypothetical protein
MLLTLNRVLIDVNNDLKTLLKAQDLPVNELRKFIVDSSMLDVAELYLYSAFAAPSDELYYLPEDNSDWV